VTLRRAQIPSFATSPPIGAPIRTARNI
jgi:hypothetical protein